MHSQRTQVLWSQWRKSSLDLMDIEPHFWRVRTDRQNDSLRSLWLFWLGLQLEG